VNRIDGGRAAVNGIDGGHAAVNGIDGGRAAVNGIDGGRAAARPYIIPNPYSLLPHPSSLPIFASNNAVPSLRLVRGGKSGLQWAPHPVKSGGFVRETAR